MPAKTTKKTASRPRSSVTKSKQLSSPRRLDKKKSLIIIAVLAVIGAFLFFRASAATTNFEAEINNQVPTVSDTTASGGKYAQFSTATTPPTTTNGTARFPGDPNPLVSGKAYFGATVYTPETGESFARHETPAGKSLSVNRNFYGWNNASMAKDAKADLAANRLPFYSAKPPGTWADLASGARDADLDNMLRSLDSAGGPVWFALQHEPEDNSRGTSATEKCEQTSPESCLGTPAEWRAMQKHIRDRMNAIGTKNIAFMPILMSWTFDTRSGRTPADWWQDGIWDAFIVDHYHNSLTSAVSTDAAWANFAKWAESKKMPFGTAEWGVRSGGAEGVGYYQDHAAGNDCSPLVPRATTAEKEALAKQRHQEFWDWGFANKKDVIVHTYFDTCRNSGASSWNLGGTQLTTFQDILKNDGRVKRVKDAVATTASALPTTYGKVKADVTLPESGAYKLWVRMKAADTVNNSVQVQIDTGAITNLGGTGVSSTAWTWVQMPTVNLTSGAHTITLTGIQKDIKVDRVIVTNETCVPEGTGDLCAIATPPPPVAPTVTVSGVSNGQTVAGTVPVTVTSTTAIEDVSFRPDNVWATSITSAPFTFNWDTTKYPNGTHTLVTRTRAVGDPGSVYVEKTVRVNIQNKTAPSTPPTPPADTIAPTVPQNLRASLNFDWTKLKYVMALNWSASGDNVAVSNYQISRNAKALGTSTTASYVDSTNLSAGSYYTYSVTAKDAAGNRSGASSITLVTSCVLISCTATVK